MTQRHFKSHLFFCFFTIHQDKESNTNGKERTGQNSNLSIVESVSQITKGQIGYEEGHSKADPCEATCTEEVSPGDIFSNSDQSELAGDEASSEDADWFSYNQTKGHTQGDWVCKGSGDGRGIDSDASIAKGEEGNDEERDPKMDNSF